MNFNCNNPRKRCQHLDQLGRGGSQGLLMGGETWALGPYGSMGGGRERRALWEHWGAVGRGGPYGCLGGGGGTRGEREQEIEESRGLRRSTVLPPWAMPSPTGHPSPGEERNKERSRGTFQHSDIMCFQCPEPWLLKTKLLGGGHGNMPLVCSYQSASVVQAAGECPVPARETFLIGAMVGPCRVEACGPQWSSSPGLLQWPRFFSESARSGCLGGLVG